MADVSLTFAGNATDAERAIAGLEKKYLALEEKIKRSGQKAKSSSNEALQGLTSWAASLSPIAAAYSQITNVIGVAQTSMREFGKEADDAAMKFDKVTRSLRIQMLLSGPEGKKVTEKLLGEVQRTGRPFEEVSSASEALYSRGMSREDATGEGLRAMMDAIISTASKEDPAVLAGAVQSYLKSQKKDFTAENVKGLGRDIHSLYSSTNLQLADFPFLAKEGSVFKGKLSQQEQLAVFTTLRDELDAPEAATEMRNVISRLGTAATSKSKVAALAEMGLKPEDVDMQEGEDYFTAMERMNKGLQTLPENRRDDVLKEIFEERGQAHAEYLMSHVGDTRKYLEMENAPDVDANQREAMKIGTSGLGPGRERLKTRVEYKKSQTPGATDFADKLDAARLRAMDLEGGDSWVNNLRDYSAYQNRYILGDDRAIALAYQTAEVRGGTNPFAAAETVLKKIEEEVGNSRLESEKQTQLLEQQTRQNAPKVNRNAQEK